MRKNFAVTELKVDDELKFLAFDAYGQNLAVASGDKLNLHTGKQWAEPATSVAMNASAGPVKAFAINPTSLVIASASGSELSLYGV